MFIQKRYSSRETIWRDGKFKDRTGVHKVMSYNKVFPHTAMRWVCRRKSQSNQHIVIKISLQTNKILLQCYVTSSFPEKTTLGKLLCGNTCKSWDAERTSFWIACKPLIMGQTTQGTREEADTTTQVLVHPRSCCKDNSWDLDGNRHISADLGAL